MSEWESVRSLFRLAFFTESQALKGPPCLSFHDLIAHFVTVLNNIPLSGGTSLFIHSPAEGHLGCFLVLSSMNKAAINIHLCIFCVHTTFQLSWVKYQRWWQLTCMLKSIFNFERNCQASWGVAAQFCVLRSSEWESLISHKLTRMGRPLHQDLSHPTRCGDASAFWSVVPWRHTCGALLGAGTRDPTHDKVTRRKPDRQGRSGFQGFRNTAPGAHLKDGICLSPIQVLTRPDPA